MNPQDPSQDAPRGQRHEQHPSQAPSESSAVRQQPTEERQDASAYQQPDIPAVQSQEPEPSFYQAEDSAYADPYPAGMPQPESHPHHTGSVSWSASEFIEHEKDASWFAILAAGTLIVAILAYFITRDWFTPVVIAIAGILFGVAGHRPPRQLRYSVDDGGIAIGARVYPYADFRAFSIHQEGQFKSITFMPLKRFMPPLSMYYDPADEDRIAEVLTAHLPMQDHKNDPIDNLMKKIRF